jgi:hypothetical protein
MIDKLHTGTVRCRILRRARTRSIRIHVLLDREYCGMLLFATMRLRAGHPLGSYYACCDARRRSVKL